MDSEKSTSCPDMLAFPYRINQIIRDMLHTTLPGEEAEARRTAIVNSLREVCARIEEDFK